MLVLRRQSIDFKNVLCFEELNVRAFLVYEYKVATMEHEDLLITMTLTLPVGPLVGAETFARPMCARTVSWLTTPGPGDGTTSRQKKEGICKDFKNGTF